MNDDELGSRLRTYFAERAHRRPAPADLEAILAVTARTPQRRGWPALGDALGGRVARAGRLGWVIALVALLMAAALVAVFVGGQPQHPVVAVPSPTAPTVTLGPSVPTASPVTDGCPDPTTLTPARDLPAPASILLDGQVPAGSRMVFVSLVTPAILVAGNGGSDARVVATYAPATSRPRLLGASPDGSVLLVDDNPTGFQCTGLFLVRVDGSAVTRVATPLSGLASNAVVAPDGRSVAYVAWEQGRPSGLSIDDGLGNRVSPQAPTCGVPDPQGGFGPDIEQLAWSPDGSQLAVACSSGGVDVYTVADRPLRPLTLASGNGAVVGVSWSSDSRRVLLATLPTTDAGDPTFPRLAILSFDASRVSAPIVTRSVGSVTWHAQGALFSPDGSLLLAAGSGGEYLVQVATGTTRLVLDTSAESGQWFSNDTGFVLERDGPQTFYTVRVPDGSVTTFSPQPLREGGGQWLLIGP